MKDKYLHKKLHEAIEYQCYSSNKTNTLWSPLEILPTSSKEERYGGRGIQSETSMIFQLNTKTKENIWAPKPHTGNHAQATAYNIKLINMTQNSINYGEMHGFLIVKPITH